LKRDHIIPNQERAQQQAHFEVLINSLRHPALSEEVFIVTRPPAGVIIPFYIAPGGERKRIWAGKPVPLSSAFVNTAKPGNFATVLGTFGNSSQGVNNLCDFAADALAHEHLQF
jgi:hypothetical protein